MKKFLSVLLPIVILVAACSKEKSFEVLTAGGGGGGGATDGYYLRCKLDGADKTFNVNLFAVKEVNDTFGLTQYAVAGKANADAANFESFIFQITLPTVTPVTAGSTFTVQDTSFNYVVAGIYNPNSQTIQFGSGTGDTSSNPLKFTITAISATEIAGTFQGLIYQFDINNPNNPTPPTKTITAGEFKAKFL